MKPNTSKSNSSVSRLNQKVNNMMAESLAVPTVRRASSDPPPVSTGKTLWIKRKVRIVKQIVPIPGQSGGSITVEDVKAQTSVNPFKVLKVSAWLPGRLNCEFQLGDGTWINDTSIKMTFVDIAPPARMPSVCYNIPDQLSEIMNAGSSVIVSGKSLVTEQTGAPNAVLVADVTVAYQI